MSNRNTLIATLGAVLLSGCAATGDPFHAFKYPRETFTIGGQALTLSTQRCKPARRDCVVDVAPTPDRNANWSPEVVDAGTVREAEGRFVQWRIRDTDNWTFADPGIEFKTDAGRRTFECVTTRFLVQCRNKGAAGSYDYSIRVLQDGQGTPIVKDPWVINR
jgi:hypothetical protein